LIIKFKVVNDLRGKPWSIEPFGGADKNYCLDKIYEYYYLKMILW